MKSHLFGVLLALGLLPAVTIVFVQSGLVALPSMTQTDKVKPVFITAALPFATKVSLGLHHTCAVLNTGAAKCWGGNDYGQLGIGTTTGISAPVTVSGLGSGVASIAAGWYHTCALTTGGGVKCWGDNEYGQLGNSTTHDFSTPVTVSGLTSGVSAIAANGYYTCAILSTGGVKCWGKNSTGQLGNGTTDNSSIPVNVYDLNNGVAAISSSASHTCARLGTGGIKCWGNNEQGQLGVGTWYYYSNIPVDVSVFITGVAVISAGGLHTCVVDNTGAAKCWGDNFTGQLGDGTTSDSYTPVDVVGLSSGVVAISAGQDNTCALLNTGAAKCWGYNVFGQLGDGTTIDNPIPVDVSGMSSGASVIATGIFHTCSLVSTGVVKCWGSNEFGQLGNGTTSDSSTPVRVIGVGILRVYLPRVRK